MAAIKTLAMQSIKTALETIADVTAVHRIPDVNVTDTDMMTGITIFFFDDGESRQRDGRLAHGVLSLKVIAYVPINVTNFQDASDATDNVQVELHRVMNTLSETGLPLITKIIEGEVQKDYPNDEVVVLTQAFEVTYSHKWGDGTTQANY